MRPTWVVLGIVVVVGAVAYLKLMDGSDGEGDAGEAAPPSVSGGPPALQRPTEAEAARPNPAAVAQEARAKELLGEATAATTARDRARYDRALESLKKEAWDAPSARRFAVRLGQTTLDEAKRHQGAERMRRLDQARRLLSRGVYAPAFFGADGAPTPERSALIDAIQKANAHVMTYGRRMEGGLSGVTRAFKVPPGWVPVRIVSREKLPYGHNALLFWNHRGDLNPRRLRAGEVLLLPEEPLSVHVHLKHRLLGVFIGDWFVKEFRVGVGRDDRPTPTGTFQVADKMENPDWWGPNGHVPPLDPKNELGSTWISFSSDELPVSAGFGIHGTNQPQTVGMRCSNGCVRLHNTEASELFWWVRRGSAGGEPTTVVIYP